MGRLVAIGLCEREFEAAEYHLLFRLRQGLRHCLARGYDSQRCNVGDTNEPVRRGLSKSRIAAFEQCPKRLWLSIHRRELAQTDEGAAARFATGHAVGVAACAQLPTGVMIEARPDLRAALDATRALLASGHAAPVFEATLEHDGVLVQIDILEPDAGGSWRIAEVKSSTKAKDYHTGDLATQVWVARAAGLSISKAAIRHIDSSFVLEREGDWAGVFADTELLTDIEDIIGNRAAVVAEARQILNEPEPDIAPGTQCRSPYSCEYMDYCASTLPPGPEWPVTVVPGGGGKAWLARGVTDLLDLDASALKSVIHQRLVEATRTGIPYHDPVGARVVIGTWAFPRTWLDFETIRFALPRWVGTRPYQQVPFQFSAHIEQADGTLTHQEFLSLDGGDPRRRCAEALLELPGEGAVIAYNASFETGRLRELAEAFPDLASRLLDIADRTVDLLPVTRAHWYHRDQRGSWSIKAVLPTIAPELDYGSLDVKDGMQAQAVYLEAIDSQTSTTRRAEIDAGLRTYCARDTEAMMVLAVRQQAF